MSLTILLIAVFWLQPRAMSYVGLNLLFNLAVPIALATIAQMLIMTVNDLDLSMGTFVSFVACVTATFLQATPVIGVLILAAAIATYAALGVLIHVRNSSVHRCHTRHELRLGRSCGPASCRLRADTRRSGRAPS